MLPVRKLLLTILLAFPVLALPSKAAPAFDENPTPVLAPLPEYPKELLTEGIAGTVIIRVYIDNAGSVTNAEVVKSTDARFEKSAVETVRTKWRFNPAKKDGAPVACKVSVPIRFAQDIADTK
ncbi:MAG: energy transducer TonB [Opitutaceae bacterium]|jgi:protein TonB